MARTDDADHELLRSKRATLRMDIKKIITDSGVALLRNVVTIVGGILLVPIITKLMGTETYGTWVVLLSLIAIFKSTGELHLHGALVRYTSRETTDGQTLIDTLVLTTLAAVVVVLVFVVLTFHFGLIQLLGIRVSDPGILIASALLIGLRILLMLLRNFPRSRNQVKTFELIMTAEVVLKNLLLIGVLTYTRSIEMGLWTLVGVYGLMNVGLLAYYLPSRLTMPDPSRFRNYLTYSIPMVPKELSHQLLNQSDKFLIAFFISPTATGIYAVSYGVASIFPQLTGILNSTLYPSVTQSWDDGNRERIGEFYTHLLTVYVLLAIPAFVGLGLLAWPLLRVLSTVEVANEGWILVPLLAIAFLTNGFENPVTYVLYAAEETKKVAIANGIAVVSNIVVNVALIPVVGLAGAAVGMIVGLTMKFVYIYWHISRYISIPVPMATIAKASFAAVLMSAVLLFGIPVALSPPVKILVYPVIGAVVYFATMILIRGIETDEIHSLRSILR